jgi:hypothetical protein
MYLKIPICHISESNARHTGGHVERQEYEDMVRRMLEIVVRMDAASDGPAHDQRAAHTGH